MANFDLKSEIKIIEELTSLAQRVCAVASTDTIELFIGEVTIYTSQFSIWQDRIENLNPLGSDSSLSDSDKAELKKHLQTLNDLHQEVMALAGQFREFLGSKLGDFHKRAQGIRSYVAPSKEPITITGKRRG